MLAFVNTPHGEAPIELREVDEPHVADREALVETHAISLNRGELALLAARPEGWRPGQDIAGVVVRRAADGTGPDVGARVAGLAEQGGWAQHVAVPTARLAVLPASISFAQGASLPLAGHAALRIVRLCGALVGRRVLITGAAGGVGQFAVQLAALAGAEVTGVVGHIERGAGLRELGAHSVITSVERADGPFDAILESVGGASLAATLSLVAPHGVIVSYGNSSGEDTPFNLLRLFGHEGMRLHTFFSYAPGVIETIGADLASLLALADTCTLKTSIGMQSDWHDLVPALAALRRRQIQGKAVFLVN